MHEHHPNSFSEASQGPRRSSHFDIHPCPSSSCFAITSEGWLHRAQLSFAISGVAKRLFSPQAIMLVPPPNYGMVEENFYRSGQPDQLNFPFLEKLGLKSVIWLAPEEPEPGFLDFCVDQNIELHHLGVLYSTNAWDPITEEVVLQALHLLVQPATYPVLVMCNLGRHRTGTVVGCFRKLQRWNLSAILEEYRRFVGGQKYRILNEQFIELFDEELVFGASY